MKAISRKGLFQFTGIIMILFFLSSCDKGEVSPTVDLDAIREEDNQKIDEYIAENNLSPEVITESGARYVIQNPGKGDLVELNDIITYDYIASDLDGLIFRTTMEEVTDTVFTTFPVTSPTTFTYTGTGWTLEFTREVDELQGDGLNEAITDALQNMGAGGHLTVLLPSELGFGPFTDDLFIISSYSVIRYEIFLREIRK